jgi:acyl-[acyl-carrier-protein]-phospholipid O-acyltransferase/long-chain-fatty-acid--[acyl-carrier-protein] ligase
MLLGVLPFFHVFGYTVSMWAVAGLDVKGAYHYSPLDAKQIGKLCREQKGTLLLATPTFLRTYLRRCEKEDFATLDVVVTGAEKLPHDVSAAFKEKFGVEPVEGYGATETTPLVSVNIPPSRSRGQWHVDFKPGTVGRPVSGVSARVVSLDTGEVLPSGQPGMLEVTGPNIMQGYWERPDLTEEVMKDGWYITGDVATLDDDGFITITGRQSRFSKLGGEMVPHIHIEETLNKLLGASDDEMKAAVTAVSDPKKGERLVVLHTKIDKNAEELRKGLTEAGMPNLFLPATDSFFEVEKIPVLGTGKLDLKGLKSLAEEKIAEERTVKAS